MEREITRLDNNPPSDAAILQEKLHEETYELRQRFEELTQSFKRVPETCDDEATASRMTDMVRMIQSSNKSFEAKRVEKKEPFLTLCSTVDAFFKTYTTTGVSMIDNIKLKILAHQKKVEAEARRIADEQARIKREEAERLAAEAQSLAAANMTSLSEQVMTEAVAAEEESLRAQAMATAKPAELSRSRGNFGGTSSMQKTWKGVIVSKDQLDLEKLRPYMSLTDLEKAVNAFVRSGGRDLKGAKIEEVSSVRVA